MSVDDWAGRIEGATTAGDGRGASAAGVNDAAEGGAGVASG
jgi:hypothetical protein